MLQQRAGPHIEGGSVFCAEKQKKRKTTKKSASGRNDRGRKENKMLVQSLNSWEKIENSFVILLDLNVCMKD